MFAGHALADAVAELAADDARAVEDADATTEAGADAEPDAVLRVVGQTEEQLVMVMRVVW